MKTNIKLNSEIFQPLTDEQLDALSLKEAITVARTEQSLRLLLLQYANGLEEKIVQIQDNYIRLKTQIRNISLAA